jgi:hypothetical protein
MGLCVDSSAEGNLDPTPIRCYDDLIEVIRGPHWAELEVTRETVDNVSGLQPGYQPIAGAKPSAVWDSTQGTPMMSSSVLFR